MATARTPRPRRTEGQGEDKKADDKGGKKAGEPEKAEAGAKEDKAKETGVKGEVEVQELSRLQQTVARRMAESKATVPDFSLALDGRHDAARSRCASGSRSSRTRSRRTTTWSSRRARSRCASTRASTAPTATASSSCTTA